MPIRSDGRRRGRTGRHHSDLDWFAEDPWKESDVAALESDDDEEWYPGLWDDDEDWASDSVGDEWGEDPYDGWGPVRRRRTRPSDER